MGESERLCACLTTCGDVAESDDHPLAVCKQLPVPREPLVEFYVVDRNAE